MDFQTKEQHFSSQIITTNRQFVSNQTAEASFNNHVQMGTANPVATTTETPWEGLNQMFVGSKNMVIQPTPNPTDQSGQANMPPNEQRKRSRTDAMTNQELSYHNICFPIPDYAPQNLKDDMIRLRETDLILCQDSKRIKLQFAEKQNQVVQHVAESARAQMLTKLKEKDAEILNLRNLNMALQEGVKNQFDENQKMKKEAITRELKNISMRNNFGVLLTELRRLQGLVPRNEHVGAALHEEEVHDVKSYCGSNVCEKAKAQVLAVKDVSETAVQVQTSAEKGEGSGEKSMCMRCREMGMTVLALPCWHLCFCRLCGFRDSSVYRPCPVCETTMIATAPATLI